MGKKFTPKPQSLPPEGVTPDDYREYFTLLKIEVYPQLYPQSLPPK